MLLAIDASRAAEAQKTGVGWYCHHLLQHLKDVIPHDVRVILYSDQPLPEELRPWPQSWQERVLRRHGPMWSQLVLANAVLHDRPDALFVPAHVIPFTLTLAPRSKRPRLVTTIHDVVFKQFPESYAPRERWYADHATRLAVRHADRIIVPTEAVRRDLERYYQCDVEKVAVVHHGVTPFVISTEASEVSAVEKSHKTVQQRQDVRSLADARDDEKVVLYVGRLERKKNVARMVDAFSRVASQHPDARLVLAGPPGYGYAEVRAAIDRSSARARITETGWVDQEQYHALLRRATLFLFPTLGEGFGLPILEAMAAGVPVITSRAPFRSVRAKEVDGAHEEVAGNAALLVDPVDPGNISDAIERVLTDQCLREDLVRLGQQRASDFTWQRSAKATWDALQSVLSA